MRAIIALAISIAVLSCGCSQNKQPQADNSPAAHADTDISQQNRPNADAPVASKFDALAVEQLDGFVESVQQSFGIPGIAIGVIDHGKIVYRKGFGVTDVDNGDPVTPHTLFNLGHVTKALSGYLMASLVHDGGFKWETPVIDLLPVFDANAPEVTQTLTIGDALCDCTGMPGSLMASFFIYENDSYFNALDRIRKISRTPLPGSRHHMPLRSRNNALFSVACYAAALRQHSDRSAEAAYRELLQERVLTPLKMTSTTYTPNPRETAFPHGVTLDENVRRIVQSPNRTISSLEPAYGLWSNVDDMLKLVQAELDSKMPENLERRKVRAVRDENRARGIAMRIHHRREQNVLVFQNDHVGYAAMIFMIPERKLGAVILANATFARFNIDLIGAKILDIALDQSSAAWLLEEATHKFQAARQTVARMIGNYWKIEPDHAWYKPLVGTYQEDLLGKITISDNGSEIILDAGEWRSRLGVRIDNSGVKSVLLIDPPLAGLVLNPVFEKKKVKALEIHEPFVTYLFKPVSP